MLDMHCHLDLYQNPQAIVRECTRRKLYVLSVTTTPKAWHGTSQISKDAPRIQTALGLHPQLAHERNSELELFDQLLPKTRYVGEVGLDGSRNFKSHRDMQLMVFSHILTSLSRVGGRIISIHSVNSAETVVALLRQFPHSGIPIFHWFSGSKSQLKDALLLNSWFSVNPAMLQSKRGQSLLEHIPRNRILPETDGPFAKHKGRSLMPWDVDVVIHQLSDLWGLNVEDSQSTIMENFRNLAKMNPAG